jgi:mannose-1-phosphate guanylyltransferase
MPEPLWLSVVTERVDQPASAPTSGPVPGFYAIVPAGGAGTRLWPLSRAGHPKFLLDLSGSGRTLLQETWDRLEPLTGPAGINLVTGRKHAPAVAGQLDALPEGNLFGEPAPRDSTAAICLAAAVIGRRDPDAVVGSFASDHVIRVPEAFHAAIREAVAVARQGYVVTIGIQADHPSTAFGYIRAGAALDVTGAPSARIVEKFVEKPDAMTASEYLAEGNYRWNAGMFIARADVLLAQLAATKPDLRAGLDEIAAAWDTPQREEVLERVWPGLEKIAIDYAVAEPAAAAGRVAVVPGDFGWDDVGDFAALHGLVDASGDTPEKAVRVLGDGEVLVQDSTGLVIPNSGRVVAVLGLDDVVVVDTPDALLVTTRDRAQDVKLVVEQLKARGRAEVL